MQCHKSVADPAATLSVWQRRKRFSRSSASGAVACTCSSRLDKHMRAACKNGRCSPNLRSGRFIRPLPYSTSPKIGCPNFAKCRRIWCRRRHIERCGDRLEPNLDSLEGDAFESRSLFASKRLVNLAVNCYRNGQPYVVRRR